MLPSTAPVLRDKIEELRARGMIGQGSRVLLVDDGSRDGTWEIIESLAASDPCLAGIRLSRNRGHQNALLAGLMEAMGYSDITISIDADGQDDIDAMDAMVQAYADGYEVVYGVRSDRESDTLLKRTTAEAFYRLLRWMGAEVVYNHADYRLISSRVLEELARYREVNLYLRGLIPLIGYESTEVPYVRRSRVAGESHYPLSRMLALALDGITSLSVRPIRIVTGLGVLVAGLSLIGVIWTIVCKIAGRCGEHIYSGLSLLGLSPYLPLLQRQAPQALAPAPFPRLSFPDILSPWPDGQ